mmetsp:Transcript_24606/g.54174  ORF Transcript_24606/g.54174 Transcript_24606/m.54174 type:complete len:145 (+) Transcript_24606:674-1108(+)
MILISEIQRRRGRKNNTISFLKATPGMHSSSFSLNLMNFCFKKNPMCLVLPTWLNFFLRLFSLQFSLLKVPAVATVVLRITSGSTVCPYLFAQQVFSNARLVGNGNLIHRYNPFRKDIVPDFYDLFGKTKWIGKRYLSITPINY